MSEAVILQEIRVAIGSLRGVQVDRVTPVTASFCVKCGKQRDPRGACPYCGAAQVRTARAVAEGFPDLLVVVDGIALAIEVKTAEGRQRPSQASFQAAHEAAGGLYVVCRSTEDALDAVARARVLRQTPPCNHSESLTSPGASGTRARVAPKSGPCASAPTLFPNPGSNKTRGVR